jgi:hypothetical protein
LCFAKDEKPVVPAKIDSASIQKISPDTLKENALFSDPNLHYKTKTMEGKGFFEKLLDWLAEKLFGKAGYDSVDAARSIIIWTVIIVCVLIVIWLLWRSELVSLIRAKPKSTSFNFSDITEELSSINFEERIKTALAAGDLRLAIRWHYLKLLYVLDLKKLISFAPYKTNIDYGNELRSQNYQGEFKLLSRLYDYVWYGKFPVTHKEYTAREEEFRNFEKKINVQGQ